MELNFFSLLIIGENFSFIIIFQNKIVVVFRMLLGPRISSSLADWSKLSKSLIIRLHRSRFTQFFVINYLNYLRPI